MELYPNPQLKQLFFDELQLHNYRVTLAEII